MTPKRKKAPTAPIVPDIGPLVDQEAFDAALERLAALDAPFVATTLAAGPRPDPRRREPGFEGLVWIVVSQQVSTASAAAIFARCKARLGSIDAATVLAASDEDMRICGLSRPKQRTMRAIAAAVIDGDLAFERLGAMDAEAAHEHLCAIKGIGPWTADVFLLFCLGHADAWPAGDLALREAAKSALGLPARPGAAELHALGERWRPYRGVAAHCLWAYYRTARMNPTTSDARPTRTTD